MSQIAAPLAEVIFQQVTYGDMPVVVEALQRLCDVLVERGEWTDRLRGIRDQARSRRSGPPAMANPAKSQRSQRLLTSARARIQPRAGVS